jgi:putative transposase
MAKGFVYLVVMMDWASRKALAWRVSSTMSTDACTDALEEAIARYGRKHPLSTVIDCLMLDDSPSVLVRCGASQR